LGGLRQAEFAGFVLHLLARVFLAVCPVAKKNGQGNQNTIANYEQDGGQRQGKKSVRWRNTQLNITQQDRQQGQGENYPILSRKRKFIVRGLSRQSNASL